MFSLGYDEAKYKHFCDTSKRKNLEKKQEWTGLDQTARCLGLESPFEFFRISHEVKVILNRPKILTVDNDAHDDEEKRVIVGSDVLQTLLILLQSIRQVQYQLRLVRHRVADPM